EDSLAALVRAGLVDDARFAHLRAETLAGRGYGDAAVRHDLERQGVSGTLVEVAIRELEPEIARSRRIVERRGRGPRTARYLAGKGFGEEAVQEASGIGFANDP